MRLTWLVTMTVFSLIAVSGCDLDLALDFDGPSIGLASDDGTLVISGCASDGLLGCADPQQPPVSRMDVVLDGVRVPVPAHVPAPFELFPSRSMELVTRSPDDPYIVIALGAREVTVEELPWFDLDAPASVHRSEGPVRLVFQAYRDASVELALTSMCGTTPQFQTFPVATGEDGRVDVPMTNPLFHGDCTHEARLTQTLAVANQLGASLSVGRTEHISFTSSN